MCHYVLILCRTPLTSSFYSPSCAKVPCARYEGNPALLSLVYNNRLHFGAFVDLVMCCYILPSLPRFCMALGEKRRELYWICFPSSVWFLYIRGYNNFLLLYSRHSALVAWFPYAGVLLEDGSKEGGVVTFLMYRYRDCLLGEAKGQGQGQLPRAGPRTL